MARANEEATTAEQSEVATDAAWLLIG